MNIELSVQWDKKYIHVCLTDKKTDMQFDQVNYNVFFFCFYWMWLSRNWVELKNNDLFFFLIYNIIVFDKNFKRI